MRLKRLTAFLLVCMCFNSGCVYESMTSRLYRGEYIDIEPERKFIGTVKDIRAINAKDKLILKLNYEVEKSKNDKAAKYDEFYNNNCLTLYIEPKVKNTINIDISKNIECRLKRIKNSYYHNIYFWINYRQKKDDPYVGMSVKAYMGLNADCHENKIKKSNEIYMLRNFGHGYENIFSRSEFQGYKFSSICVHKENEDVVGSYDVPISYSRSVQKYVYENSLTKRIVQTPLALAFDIVSLPFFFLLAVTG